MRSQHQQGLGMKLNQRSIFDWVMHTKAFLVIALSICLLLGYVANQYFWRIDLTQNSRNSLSQQSIDLLVRMPSAIDVTVFALKDDVTNGDKFRQSMLDFMARYQRIKPNITLNMLSAHDSPTLAREENITVDGEMVVKYQQQSMRIIPPLNEERFTNLLLKLSRAESRHIGVLDSVEPLEQPSEDEPLLLKKTLNSQGYSIKKIAESDGDFNAAHLGALILNSTKPMTADQEALLQQYIARGGNLLLLADSQTNNNFTALSHQLGLTVNPQIIKQEAENLDGDGHHEVYANYYAQHAITQQFSLKTIFHAAHEITGKPALAQGWKVTPLVLVASAQADATQPSFQKASLSEPILVPHQVVLAYERNIKEKVQRIVVIGDTRFLAQQSLQHVANQQFVGNILQWLTFDAIKLSIKPKRLMDVNMIVLEQSVLPKLIGYTVQYLIPTVLILLTFFVLHRRRKS
jgi:ABC-type uncharacterized transport system involved in gliding motility auxiliary subunit